MAEQSNPVASAADVNTDPTGTPEQLAALYGAFVKAQKAFAVPKKTKTAKIDTAGGRSYSYKYSTLDDLIEATRPALTDNGLACFQKPKTTGAQVSVVTVIAHANGARIESDPLTLRASSDAPQQIGAALTYARRYSMSSYLGVAAEDDDDGSLAQGKEQGARRVQRPDEHDQRPDAERAAKDEPKKDSKKDDKSNIPTGKAYKGETAKPSTDDGGKKATRQQLKRLVSICNEHKVSMNALKAFLADAEPPIKTLEDVPADRYDSIVKAVQNGLVEEPK